MIVLTHCLLKIFVSLYPISTPFMIYFSNFYSPLCYSQCTFISLLVLTFFSIFLVLSAYMPSLSVFWFCFVLVWFGLGLFVGFFGLSDLGQIMMGVNEYFDVIFCFYCYAFP